MVSIPTDGNIQDVDLTTWSCHLWRNQSADPVGKSFVFTDNMSMWFSNAALPKVDESD